MDRLLPRPDRQMFQDLALRGYARRSPGAPSPSARLPARPTPCFAPRRLPGRTLNIAKTNPDVRRGAVVATRDAVWVSRLGVTINDVSGAEGNEDDFDGCLSAAALLRCTLEGEPLYSSEFCCAEAERGMPGLARLARWRRVPGALFLLAAHRHAGPRGHPEYVEYMMLR